MQGLRPERRSKFEVHSFVLSVTRTIVPFSSNRIERCAPLPPTKVPRE
jgi:hypothetical protein